MAALLAAVIAPPLAARPEASAPTVDDAVDSAVGAYTLVEVAAGCGWLQGAADVGKARSGALAFALSGLPVPLKAQALSRLFADDEKLLVAATSSAQGRVREGACKRAATRTTWDALSGWLDKLSAQRTAEPQPAPQAKPAPSTGTAPRPKP